MPLENGIPGASAVLAGTPDPSKRSYVSIESHVATGADEPILRAPKGKSKYVFFPIQHHDVYAMYKKAVSVFWTVDEINFAQDLVDLGRLSANEKQFINHVLAFFAASDGIVMENLDMRFLQEVQLPEAKAFYAFQEAMEAVHSETYSLLIDTYVKDPAEKERLFHALEHFPAIKEKADWAIRWIQDEKASFAQRLLAFSIVEGIFFSGAFCAIFWMRERGLLPGLSMANQLISRDENLHAEFAILLYSKLAGRLPAALVYDMIDQALEIEDRFINEAIPCNMIGMNRVLMSQYLRFVAKRHLQLLGYEVPERYQVGNPFPFMERSATESKGNFFECKISEYAKPVSLQAGQAAIPTEFKVNTDADDF